MNTSSNHFPVKSPFKRSTKRARHRLQWFVVLALVVASGVFLGKPFTVKAGSKEKTHWFRVFGGPDKAVEQTHVFFPGPTFSSANATPDVAAQKSEQRRGLSYDREVRLVAEARRLYHAGKLKAAQRKLKKLLELAPYSLDARELQAQLALDSGDLRTYAQCLSELIALGGDSPELLDSAGRRLAQCASAFPDRPEWARTAQNALLKAARLRKNRQQYVRDLAASLILAEDWPSAVEEFKRLISDSSSNSDLATLARLSELAGRWPLAKELYSVLVRRQPLSLRWHAGLGRAAYNLGEYKTACDELAWCLNGDSQALSLLELVQLGDAALRTGRYKLAEHSLQQVAQRQSKPLKEVELLRAVCAYHRGNFAQARSVLSAALTYWPNDPELRQALERLKLPSDNTRPADTQQTIILAGAYRPHVEKRTSSSTEEGSAVQIFPNREPSHSTNTFNISSLVKRPQSSSQK